MSGYTIPAATGRKLKTRMVASGAPADDLSNRIPTCSQPKPTISSESWCSPAATGNTPFICTKAGGGIDPVTQEFIIDNVNFRGPTDARLQDQDAWRISCAALAFLAL